ncbi:hypothetical protein M5K25_025070 [Dendrobium thyrsiflorum]|uniref:Uncharacterized protein n=1 Tax=Dendrobium thyrsiflorum TaxID=117978 RepID=A0ABD0U8P7_DENTH
MALIPVKYMQGLLHSFWGILRFITRFALAIKPADLRVEDTRKTLPKPSSLRFKVLQPRATLPIDLWLGMRYRNFFDLRSMEALASKFLSLSTGIFCQQIPEYEVQVSCSNVHHVELILVFLELLWQQHSTFSFAFWIVFLQMRKLHDHAFLVRKVYHHKLKTGVGGNEDEPDQDPMVPSSRAVVFPGLLSQRRAYERLLSACTHVADPVASFKIRNSTLFFDRSKFWLSPEFLRKFRQFSGVPSPAPGGRRLEVGVGLGGGRWTRRREIGLLGIDRRGRPCSAGAGSRPTTWLQGRWPWFSEARARRLPRLSTTTGAGVDGWRLVGAGVGSSGWACFGNANRRRRAPNLTIRTAYPIIMKTTESSNENKTAGNDEQTKFPNIVEETTIINLIPSDLKVTQRSREPQQPDQPNHQLKAQEYLKKLELLLTAKTLDKNHKQNHIKSNKQHNVTTSRIPISDDGLRKVTNRDHDEQIMAKPLSIK